MDSKSRILGCCILVFVGIVFHFLQEDHPVVTFSPLISFIREWNKRFASRFRTTEWRVVELEIGGFGFTLMQIGEWIAAIICWVGIASVGIAVSVIENLRLKGQNKKTSFLVLLVSAAGWIALAAVLIAVTTLRKPDNEPWSNLQKLWNPKEPKPPFSIRMTSLATNGLLAFWGLDDNAAHSGYFCRVPTVAEVYLTNNQTHWTIVNKVQVEAMDVNGQWRSLGIIDTVGVHPFYKGLDLRHVQPEEPVDGKYFDQQIAGRNIGPGETASGWLFLNQNLAQDVRGPLRFSVSDLQGGPYVIGPVSADTPGLPWGGFRTGQGFADLSGLTREDCPQMGVELK